MRGHGLVAQGEMLYQCTGLVGYIAVHRPSVDGSTLALGDSEGHAGLRGVVRILLRHSIEECRVKGHSDHGCSATRQQTREFL
jgi:hypothetical protein